MVIMYNAREKIEKMNEQHAGDTKGRVHRARAKRRLARTRLPTPPPDPTLCADDDDLHRLSESSERDAQFFEYINSLQKGSQLGRSDSIFAPAAAAEDAFDHLDKLYKLMEQMLNLRQQNAHLQRRIRDLEHLRNLQSLHRQTDGPSGAAAAAGFEDIPELDDDSSFAESLLDAMLTGTKKDAKAKPWTRSRIRQSLMRKQRNRSCSLNERAGGGGGALDFDDAPNPRRASAGVDRDKSSKVSKWTKVKAAFRWEKASPSVTGAAKSQENVQGGMLPVNYEIACYLRVPSTSDETGTSPTDFGGGDGSTPGTLSSASSADDVHRQGETRRGILRGDSDEDRRSYDNNVRPYSKEPKENRTAFSRLRKLSRSSRDEKDLPKHHHHHHRHHHLHQNGSSKMDVSDNEDEEKCCKKEIPAAVIARYREAVAEEESTHKQNPPLKPISKWTRVKKAFLTTGVATNNNNNKHPAANSSTLALGAPKEIRAPNATDDETRRIQDEIQHNYRELQKKLSLEFQIKLQEWERLKASGAAAAAGPHSRAEGPGDEQRDPAFMKKMEEWQRMKSHPSPKTAANVQMIREEDLAPEFKKKLEEWQRIKKYAAKDDSATTSTTTATVASKAKKKLGEWPKWKSVSGHREEPAQGEHQPLSDEFLKKLEEWRKMKEASRRGEDVKEKTPSPRVSRRHHHHLLEVEPSAPNNRGKKGKDPDRKELQWFEKELDKIEREKQRLEQEREKFLQREERLTKLRRTVMGEGNKKDVLVHTPSGFYRFEGISRKFTQKLCEWEKAQGIGPEASTFALLSSNFTPHITVDLYETDARGGAVPQFNGGGGGGGGGGASRLLMRSKSAESLGMSNLMQPGPAASHHPSSLSLNDVDELEKQCLALSRDSSVQDMGGSYEKMENEEPEAVIVEIEDVEEETAAPLEERLQEKHFPVYQRESALNTCEKSPSIPCLQRADSKSVQYCYFLIEDATKMVTGIGKEEDEEGPDLETTQLGDVLLQKLTRLQEIHSRNISEVTMEGRSPSSSHFSDLLEAAQNLFAELFGTAERLRSALVNATDQEDESGESGARQEIASQICDKLSELKRTLTYFYAASDMTAPKKKRTDSGGGKKSPFGEQKEAPSPTDEQNQQKKPEAETGKEQESLTSKRMRYKKKDFCNKTVCESEDSDLSEQKSGESPDRDRRETDGDADDGNEPGAAAAAVALDQVIVDKLVIPTKTNYVNVFAGEPEDAKASPVEVFVKTTRKLFTPIIAEARISPEIHVSPSKTGDGDANSKPANDPETKEIDKQAREGSAGLPPPVPSPSPQRKASKEISPSIRLMLAKYNQMISGQEGPGTSISATSSGSASPIAWRSPVSERRVRAQRERYLEELDKMEGAGGKEVKKSASVSALNLCRKTALSASSRPQQATISEGGSCPKIGRGILRSTSTGLIQNNGEAVPPLRLVIPENGAGDAAASPANRSNRLKKAREDFLNSGAMVAAGPGPSSAPPVFPGDLENGMRYPGRSRFSQISVGSESSCDSSACEGVLIKSASAGMINVDEDTYRQIDPAFHREGYVSLPRTAVKKEKEGFLGGKLALSNIAAKFRKVKMRRNKDQKKKMNTVSALCRQSLVVDINPGSQESIPAEVQSRSNSLTVPQSESRASSSEDTSPSSSRSGSWIRKSRIFKVL